ncbi:hypothetical protein SANA_02350 [Gottschalkiaceae bacterium SANA]|nr:hypothetical protein SANA_02350 [Gottschalkiaceae bacterium SANA]
MGLVGIRVLKVKRISRQKDGCNQYPLYVKSDSSCHDLICKIQKNDFDKFRHSR